MTFIVDLAAHPGKVTLFILSAVSLVPLAWLIGEATEHAGEHTGPRIGGLLNASFGNAPEVIIAVIAIADNLPNVVRGSMAGSVVSNILLVLGAALVLGPDNARLNRNSLVMQLGLVFLAVLLLLAPSIPGWHGNADRHSLALLRIGPPVERPGRAPRRSRRRARVLCVRPPAGARVPADRAHGHGRIRALRRIRDSRRPLQTLGGRTADRRLRSLRRLVPGGRRPLKGRLTVP